MSHCDSSLGVFRGLGAQIPLRGSNEPLCGGGGGGRSGGRGSYGGDSGVSGGGSNGGGGRSFRIRDSERRRGDRRNRPNEHRDAY